MENTSLPLKTLKSFKKKVIGVFGPKAPSKAGGRKDHFAFPKNAF